MDIIKDLLQENGKFFYINFNFNKVGFLLDMLNLIEHKISPRSYISYNDFIMYYFIPCVKKYIIGNPILSTGGMKI